jgi:hypothetical protein
MFNFLKESWIAEEALENVSKVASILSELMEYFEAERFKGENIRDSAIDALIKILEQEKTPKA